MALFTGKGDKGTTKLFDSEPGKRVSKASCRTEALGACDEINSFLGLCKVKAKDSRLKLKGVWVADIVDQVQQSLFIIQAELAGAGKSITEEKVKNMEALINIIEQEMPPIKTFFVSGGTEFASLFDIARTIARRTERTVIGGIDEGEVDLSQWSLAYLNRLSSLLYAFARFSNHKFGIKEDPPKYE